MLRLNFIFPFILFSCFSCTLQDEPALVFKQIVYEFGDFNFTSGIDTTIHTSNKRIRFFGSADSLIIDSIDSNKVVTSRETIEFKTDNGSFYSFLPNTTTVDWHGVRLNGDEFIREYKEDGRISRYTYLNDYAGSRDTVFDVLYENGIFINESIEFEPLFFLTDSEEEDVLVIVPDGYLAKVTADTVSHTFNKTTIVDLWDITTIPDGKQSLTIELYPYLSPGSHIAFEMTLAFKAQAINDICSTYRAYYVVLRKIPNPNYKKESTLDLQLI